MELINYCIDIPTSKIIEESLLVNKVSLFFNIYPIFPLFCEKYNLLSYILNKYFLGNTVVSARIAECGYAWVVCGRRLLIWQYRHIISAPGTPQRKHGNLNQCFELLLPQSDLAHRAELVSVFISTGSNIPSCIAVSPEGILSYLFKFKLLYLLHKNIL